MTDAACPKASPDDLKNLMEGWIQALAQDRSPTEISLLRRALDFSQKAHSHQFRASGEPYLTHAMAVADILIGWRLDAESIAAAILHDVLEDTNISISQLKRAFGSQIARLVDGVTKVRYGDLNAKETGKKGELAAQNLHKLLLASADDVRVALIKLADRLHNMRTLQHLSEEKKRRIARETMNVFVPLADRLGIWQLKSELEDLVLRYLQPNDYEEIARFLEKHRLRFQKYLDEAIGVLRQQLERRGIAAEITGRVKGASSLWQNMRRHRLRLHEVHDVLAVRVLVDSEADCYHVLGIVHGLWRMIPGNFDDYIGSPKQNNYQSLHTGVIGPGGESLEVQIRTWEMDAVATLGVAAHWLYKKSATCGAQATRPEARWLAGVQVLCTADDATELSHLVRSEAFHQRIYVIAPSGEVIDLPKGSTPLDFAYSLDPELGHRCRGARVNGRIVPLTYQLQSGERTEVLLARHSEPNRQWLDPDLGYLHTLPARQAVHAWFQRMDSFQSREQGQEVLRQALHRLGVADLSLEGIVAALGKGGFNETLIAIGRAEIPPQEIAKAVQELVDPLQQEASVCMLSPKNIEEVRPTAAVRPKRLSARCCNPPLGGRSIGLISEEGTVKIHRPDCGHVLNLPQDKRMRLIEVAIEDSVHGNCLATIEIQAFERQGLLADVFSLISAEGAHVRQSHVESSLHTNSVRIMVALSIGNVMQLSRLLNRLHEVPNVIQARRISQKEGGA